MIEIEAVKVVSLCLSSFSVGIALTNAVWTFLMLGSREKLAKKLANKGRNSNDQRKDRHDL